MKPNRIVLLFILAFLFVKSFFLSLNVWWDPAVYMGMGKHIFSLGGSGLWEVSRPLVWPVILGAVWKLGLNPVILSRMLSLFFTAGSAYIIYLIGKQVFDDKVAVLSAALFLFSPTVFFNSDLGLTGIPSTFFGLLAVWFFLRKRFFPLGFFAGLAFMTRFLQLLIFAGIGIILLAHLRKRKITFRQIYLSTLGFLVPVVPFLLLNLYLYGSILYPFFVQATLTRYTGWMWWEPLNFYFRNLFKENFLVLFSLPGFFFLLRKKYRTHARVLLFTVFILFFSFYNLNIHKEMRFAITFFPYLYLITSLGIVRLFDMIKKEKQLASIFLVLIVFLFGLRTFIQYEREPVIPHYGPFWEYVENNEGVFWITNPVFIVNSDEKAEELIYYSTTGVERFRQLTPRIDQADHILINTCDIPCPPGGSFCDEGKNAFMTAVRLAFEKVHHHRFWDCEFLIFRKR